ncbi:MAG: hypothetical protein KAJ29_00210 [Alphaproteobacteria bacterium]|nr:hypothetical protein [Alphaproteobacteria bacterium]
MGRSKICIMGFLVVLCACSRLEIGKFPDIGDEFPLEKLFDQKLMVSSGQIDDVVYVSHKGLNVDIALDGKGKVSYIRICDPAYVSQDGISPGAVLRDICEITSTELKSMPGWGYWLDLPSGWKVSFCVGDSCTDTEPDPDTPSKCFFKSKYHW